VNSLQRKSKLVQRPSSAPPGLRAGLLFDEVEADRDRQIDVIATQNLGRRWIRLRPLQKRQRFLVECARPRSAHHATFKHTPLAVKAEEDLRHTLLAAGLRLLRVVLVLFEQRHDLVLPIAHRRLRGAASHNSSTPPFGRLPRTSPSPLVASCWPARRRDRTR
jgi:hypothetical protein